MPLRVYKCWLLAVLLCLSFTAGAQTLTISSGVQKYATLTSTTVTMTAKCELWVTNSAPLSGCTINLNSIDAWLFLPAVKPSVTISTYLSQVKVNGTAASSGINVRVVQYGQYGAIVIPQSSSFQPMTTFTGAQFTGTGRNYNPYSYYTGSAITNISSFKLKRGYQVVFAQSSNGKNWSKCYVAQDGDLEIGQLPTNLNQQVQFVYVTPWRWIAKKGIAGNPGNSWLNVNWWYDWNIDQSTSSDLEYVAIRQLQSWPSLSQNWQSLGINTVLGYNEPDQANQANLSVATAISSWGDLLATGLRVGSPATSDGGPNTWLIPFVSQADAAGLRVDFVATHYYQAANPTNASACASQMYNFLLNIWNNTHRPIWVTEWNNGANWTDGNPYPAPTYAQQQADVAAMQSMLESTPFVERYACYNWVEDQRSLITSSNTVTGAGTGYSNTVSAIGYNQTMPDNGTRGMAVYLFNTNTWDTSGYFNNALSVGAPAYVAGHNSMAQAIALDGASSYLQLPANIAKTNANFTFAAWVYWNGGANWQRLFDFGNDTSHYFFLTPSSGSGTLRFAINNGNGEQIVQATALASGSWQHVAVTLNSGTATLYVNGAQVATASGFTNSPASFSPIKNYLGKSQFAADPTFNGNLDEVEIADYAMTAAQISALYNTVQFPLYSGGVWNQDASGNWSVTNNWNAGFVPNGSGYVADFSTLNVTANRAVTLDTPGTVGGIKFGTTSGLHTWTLSGTNTLTLDAGGASQPVIAVNQNSAFLATPITGTNGFVKAGNGTAVLTTNASFGGSIYVLAGTVGITNGATTISGPGATSIGYENTSGAMYLSGNGTFTALGNVWVGGSDQNGTAYTATGTLNISNGTAYFGGSAAYSGPHYADGSLAVGAGNNNQNACSGTVSVSGGMLWCTNDLILGFAGTGTGTLNISGTGTVNVGPTATKWLSLGKWDTSGGIINISGGNLNLMNNTALKFCSGTGSNNGGGGTNSVTQTGGTITFYSNAGTTMGGTGYLDLGQSGSTTANNTYNLNGGTLIVPKVISSNTNGIRTFNFNGGTLKATAANATFFTIGSDASATANVRNGSAVIDDGGYAITVTQPLQHSAIAGDNAVDGGLTKQGAGTLTLPAAETYTGPTIINAGTLTLGSGGSIANSPNLDVNSGAVLNVSAVSGGFTLGAAQMLSGSGTINGAFANNGTISPGTNGVTGTLTWNTAPTLNGTAILKINRNNGSPQNDQITLASGTLTYGGTLTVTNIGAPLQAGDAFTLFNAASYAGSFTVTNLPALNSGLVWTNRVSVNGTIAVIATVSLAPTNVLVSVSGGNLTLSWPADHTGWRLQVQTNNLVSGLGTNWMDVPSSSLTNTLTIPLDPTQSSVFYRLAF